MVECVNSNSTSIDWAESWNVLWFYGHRDTSADSLLGMRQCSSGLISEVPMGFSMAVPCIKCTASLEEYPGEQFFGGHGCGDAPSGFLSVGGACPDCGKDRHHSHGQYNSTEKRLNEADAAPSGSCLRDTPEVVWHGS